MAVTVVTIADVRRSREVVLECLSALMAHSVRTIG